MHEVVLAHEREKVKLGEVQVGQAAQHLHEELSRDLRCLFLRGKGREKVHLDQRGLRL